MIITQDDLIKEIAAREDMDIATVRKIFKSAENCIFDYLSSTTPIQNLLIKVFCGVNIKRKYIPPKTYTKGVFQNIESPEHCNISGMITKYYKNKVNDNLYAGRESH